jgi:glutamate dehydrogenase (NAD(P)+)
MGVQLRISISDPDTELHAYVVIDSLRGGRAMGGTRMTESVDLDEVAGLAHAMTLKLALAGLPIGGAKAGITCGLSAGPERDRRIAEFGQAIEPLLRGGIYLGADQGITHRDRDLFFAAADFDVCDSTVPDLPCGWAELWRHCDTITGFGVCQAIYTAVDAIDLPGDCRTVAIQGFGLVGRAVATDLSAQGYQVLAVADRYGTVTAKDGLDVTTLLAATDSAGSIDRSRLPAGAECASEPDAWLDADVDILVLAAGGDAVRGDNVERVRARILVEGGNLACTEEAAEKLATQGVPVLPGIIANCGGAAVTGLLLLGSAPRTDSAEELAAWLFDEVGCRIRNNIATLVERGRTDPRPFDQIARDLAMERLSEFDAAALMPAG